MLPLDDDRWSELEHAYGPASDIPEHLKQAANDHTPGYKAAGPWFELWSALCHQGDVYSASYGALPHLVAMAGHREPRGQYDPLLLAGSIELARLEGRGPPMPDDLADAYRTAVIEAKGQAARALEGAWDADSRLAFAGSLAALSGDFAKARTIFDAAEE